MCIRDRASGHAYNTIREMIAAGSKKGLALVGIADHAPAMPGSTHRFYFENLRIFDRKEMCIRDRCSAPHTPASS